MIHAHIHGNASQPTTVHTLLSMVADCIVNFEYMCTTQLYCAKVELPVCMGGITDSIVSKSILEKAEKKSCQFGLVLCASRGGILDDSIIIIMLAH